MTVEDENQDNLIQLHLVECLMQTVYMYICCTLLQVVTSLANLKDVANITKARPKIKIRNLNQVQL